ncbi:AFR568Cp [Eremothecium gossypii ATCC 10895]|uniref:AFR568Cp n=1 Tax=Eremothecium gossypii (strain ATCC 10895 / CBS 109.51 / FGSC 9923 / NRRL Y-1056) TaxID=284811 RepID=Q752K6_EREGS|nr:AFR568Cp [Eremothecium gossypii ATCC 10895]AAS53939.2 AFR568Cp [Eremothecium gossypii ATCC 10895]
MNVRVAVAAYGSKWCICGRVVAASAPPARMALPLGDEGRFREMLAQAGARAHRMHLLGVPPTYWAVGGATLMLVALLTRVYGWLYERSVLVATYCSNVLLFGLSDCAAQGLACAATEASRAGGPLAATRELLVQLRPQPPVRLDEEDELRAFSDYGPRPESHMTESEGVWVEEEPRRFDFYRWGCFMLWGAVMANFQVPWYRLLNYLYTDDPTVVQVLERVLSDQLLYSPLSLYCFFWYSNYVIEGGTEETFALKIQRVYVSTLGCNYAVWPLVQFLNFLVIPKSLQVPFSSSVGVLWNIFLSLRAASSRGEGEF